MNPAVDWHAFAPDIVLVATIVVILVADLLLPNRSAWQTSRIAARALRVPKVMIWAT